MQSEKDISYQPSGKPTLVHEAEVRAYERLRHQADAELTRRNRAFRRGDPIDILSYPVMLGILAGMGILDRLNRR
jgi:hypothetical protein